MPPRCLTIGIVVFWLATGGWLFYHDVWPTFLPGQAPAYAIDLEDEVQTRQAHVRWTVAYNDRPCLRAETWVSPNPDDTFDLISELHPLVVVRKNGEGEGPQPFGGLVEIRKAMSVYRVSRRGDLRAVSIDLSAVAHAPLGGELSGEGRLEGAVRDGSFRARLKASSAAFPELNYDGDLDPVPVPAHGSVLSPMHPVNRIAGLRPGQTWRLPLVDPVRTVVSALFKKYLPGFAPDADEDVALTARVLPDRQRLDWNQEAVECRVIEYRGDDVTARTWVRADTGLVLKQEAERNGERWALVRE